MFVFFLFCFSDNKAVTAEACRTEEDTTKRAGKCVYSDSFVSVLYETQSMSAVSKHFLTCLCNRN